MKKYTVRAECWSDWGVREPSDATIDYAEIKRLALEWDKPIAELLKDVDEIND